ncbi:hypothetical protein H257_11469 [Aphanomyces astaci]|uniref:FYVE-type domain-containing protein n=1 Tax=Aphanomyces astaci TaxID=112090 RepID=W4G498_APHAT|nr:hypothetical protein H257_11469 [Aphanomyces astaci]ETV73778.1 hypothetical protein H257_11469 [Aphanomyces astaci]|eukprot:XP_009836714.1 hypothetical protein H257_11469 [Aphanomyces astaci]
MTSTGLRTSATALLKGNSITNSTISTAHSDDALHDFHTAPSHEIKPGEDYYVSWTRNEAVDGCMVCNTRFTLFLRRHHCRSCGDVVCGLCAESKREVYGLVGMHRVCDSCLTNGVWMDPVTRRRLMKIEQSQSLAQEYDDEHSHIMEDSCPNHDDCDNDGRPGTPRDEGTNVGEWLTLTKGKSNDEGGQDEGSEDEHDHTLAKIKEFYTTFAPQDLHLATAQLAHYGPHQRTLMWRMLQAHYNVSFESAMKCMWNVDDIHIHGQDEPVNPDRDASVRQPVGGCRTILPEVECANNAQADDGSEERVVEPFVAELNVTNDVEEFEQQPEEEDVPPFTTTIDEVPFNQEPLVTNDKSKITPQPSIEYEEHLPEDTDHTAIIQMFELHQPLPTVQEAHEVVYSPSSNGGSDPSDARMPNNEGIAPLKSLQRLAEEANLAVIIAPPLENCAECEIAEERTLTASSSTNDSAATSTEDTLQTAPSSTNSQSLNKQSKAALPLSQVAVVAFGRRQWLWAGGAFGLMYLSKRSTTWSTWIRNVAMLSLVAPSLRALVIALLIQPRTTPTPLPATSTSTL